MPAPCLRSGLPLVAAIVLAASVSPQAKADPGRPFDTRVIQSGHSLTDPIPPVLAGLVRAKGNVRPTIHRSTIPGSPMDWRWDHTAIPQDARTQIADYEILVLTERVSLSGTMPWHGSAETALLWQSHAFAEGDGGRGAETILYATWVSLASGPDYVREQPHDPEAMLPFRERLPLELARWEEILAHVNEKRDPRSPPMRMIPGPVIMAEVYDRIAAGTAPGLEAIDALFVDEIHLSAAGTYLIALAHLAVIYCTDVRGLPADVGQPLPPDPALAAFMQDLVWEVVTTYPHAGVDRCPTS
ncbi:hypothetical protein [Salinarimonas sp.]|uniref:hypothetical protein n=1 Tax=Salinarimonas sp. TaxID=2766526 RepID=UPI00391DA92F